MELSEIVTWLIPEAGLLDPADTDVGNDVDVGVYFGAGVDADVGADVGAGY